MIAEKQKMLLIELYNALDLNFKRIWALASRQNLHAVHLLERLHFRKVATRGDEVEYEFTKKMR